MNPDGDRAAGNGGPAQGEHTAMSRFQTTRWSLVLQAREDDPDAGRALDRLCRLYRPPVLAYVRGRGVGPAEAEDLTQSFFEQFLRLRPDRSADPARGRFRVYLLVALRRFLANQQMAGRAAKRGGAWRRTADADAVDRLVDAEGIAPDLEFERAWAAAVVSQARRQLRDEADAAGKRTLFDALSPFLLEPPDREEYARVAERLGMRRNTLAVAIHRLRVRLHDLVRALLAEGIERPEDLVDELAHLRRMLARADSV